MKTILFPILTEKSFDLLETENKVVFAVSPKATKLEIRDAVEKAYNVKVDSVNVINDFRREKKAIVKLKPDFEAGKIISDLGLM
jgi:large subunit ribosomal protein L23